MVWLLLVALKLHCAELTVGISQEFENLNPLIMTMSATSYIFGFVGRPLDVLSPNGEWLPSLAKSIPSFGNKKAWFSSDKSKLFVKWDLQDNAFWGDGTPVTCEDLAFTVQVGQSSNIAIAEREFYRSIEKVEYDPQKPKECVMVYHQPKWYFYQMGSFRLLPKHLEQPIFETYGTQPEGYEKNTLYVKNPTHAGLYNGPYVVKEVKLGSHVVLQANPRFFGRRPFFQKITIKLIPNTATIEANLRSKTIDMASSLGFTFDQALTFQKKVTQERLPYKVLFKPSLTYEHIDLNLDHPILKDINVRKALIYAIDRENLVKALFENKQKVAHHLIAPIDPWYTMDPKYVTIYSFDRKKAVELLEKSGWFLGSDGYRYKDGQRLQLTLMTTAGNKMREVVQTYLVDQWKKVGIMVTLKNEPARVLFSETVKKRRFEMVMYAWVSAPESSHRAVLSCQSIPSSENGFSGQNYTGFCDKELDSVLDQIDREFDPEKRKQLVRQVIKVYTDKAFVIPLYYRSDVAVIPQRLEKFELTGHMFPETLFSENWKLQ